MTLAGAFWGWGPCYPRYRRRHGQYLVNPVPTCGKDLVKPVATGSGLWLQPERPAAAATAACGRSPSGMRLQPQRPAAAAPAAGVLHQKSPLQASAGDPAKGAEAKLGELAVVGQ